VVRADVVRPSGTCCGPPGVTAGGRTTRGGAFARGAAGIRDPAPGAGRKPHAGDRAEGPPREPLPPGPFTGAGSADSGRRSPAGPRSVPGVGDVRGPAGGHGATIVPGTLSRPTCPGGPGESTAIVPGPYSMTCSSPRVAAGARFRISTRSHWHIEAAPVASQLRSLPSSPARAPMRGSRRLHLRPGGGGWYPLVSSMDPPARRSAPVGAPDASHGPAGQYPGRRRVDQPPATHLSSETRNRYVPPPLR
jgi:hypothetical protein